MKRVFACLVVSFLVSGTVWAQRKVDQIVARVNEDIILKSEIDHEMEIRRAQYKEEGLEGTRLEEQLAVDSKTILRDLIDRYLLLQVAKEAGVPADNEVLKTMEELRKTRNYATTEDLEAAIRKEYGDVDEFKNDIRVKFLTQVVVENEVYRRIVITNEEMRKYYDEHMNEFDKPAGVRLSQIVVLVDRRLPDQVAVQRKKIDEAMAALKTGEKFDEVAEKFSEDPGTATRGGDMGFSPKGSLNEETEKLVQPLAKSQNTDVLEFADAFVIYRVTDKHDGGILSFELAQQYIGNKLMAVLAPPKVRDFLAELRDLGFVEVKEGFADEGANPKKRANATPAKN